jgi:hypothetical protein
LTPGNAKLVRIGLFFNEINEQGASLVPDMLANKKELTSIELNGNAFEGEGKLVDDIVAALARLGKEDALVNESSF